MLEGCSRFLKVQMVEDRKLSLEMTTKSLGLSVRVQAPSCDFDKKKYIQYIRRRHTVFATIIHSQLPILGKKKGGLRNK